MARRRGRRGQQSWQMWVKLSKLAAFLGVIGATGFYAYEVGQRLSQETIAELHQEIERLTAVERDQQSALVRLQGELEETRKRADDYQAKYALVAPSEEMKEILAQVKGKLDRGVDAKRLAFVISVAEPPRACGGEVNKRFMVKTPTFDGASTWVRFSDLITVTAEGAGANGGKEQWFDPEKPVTVKFTLIGGKETQITGKLPLQHSMVAKGNEYRFTIAPGPRGFVEVTGDRCEFKG